MHYSSKYSSMHKQIHDWEKIIIYFVTSSMCGLISYSSNVPILPPIAVLFPMIRWNHCKIKSTAGILVPENLIDYVVHSLHGDAISSYDENDMCKCVGSPKGKVRWTNNCNSLLNEGTRVVMQYCKDFQIVRNVIYILRFCLFTRYHCILWKLIMLILYIQNSWIVQYIW